MTTDRAASRPLLVALALGVAAALGAVGVTALVAAVVGVPHEVLTREPQVVLDGAVYVGAFSNLGAVVWGVAAVSAALAALVLDGRERLMFAAAGVLSAAMLADDLFMLHDALYPKVGLDEPVVQALYLVAIALLVWAFRRELGLPTTLAIGAVVGCWGLSAAVDRYLNTSPLNLDQLTEDGLKFLGIALWAAVWVARAYVDLRARAHPTTEVPAVARVP